MFELYEKILKADKEVATRKKMLCKSWTKDRGEFIQWSYYNNYTPDKKLVLINPDFGYSPKNCKWASRNEKEPIYDPKPIIYYAKKYGINYKTFDSRVRNNGLFVEILDGLTPQLSDENLFPVLEYDPENNEFLGSFNSLEELNKFNGTNHTLEQVRNAIKNKTIFGDMSYYFTNVKPSAF